MSASDKKDSLVALLGACSAAWKAGDWHQLEEISQSVLWRASGIQLETSVLTQAASWYLGSLLGSGQLVARDHDFSDLLVVEDKVKKFDDWLDGQPRIAATIALTRAYLGEILLLSTDDSALSRGRTASLLRKIARPDLAIVVSDELLDRSRLNYYALANKGAAMADLGNLDDAIGLLSSALRPFHPTEGLDRPLNAISRAYRLRFERDGDVHDLERSFDYARASWTSYPSEFSARTYVAAAAEMGEDEKAEAEAATENIPTSPPLPNEEAVDRALQILQHHLVIDEATEQQDSSEHDLVHGNARTSASQSARAGLTWTTREDEDLKASFRRGASIKELASKHQRSAGAIRSRLRRQGLLE